MKMQPTWPVACFGFAGPVAAAPAATQAAAIELLPVSSVADIAGRPRSSGEIKAIVYKSKGAGDTGLALLEQLQKAGFGHLPFLLMAVRPAAETALALLRQGVTEVVPATADTETICRKLTVIIASREMGNSPSLPQNYKMPLSKRCFDVLMASLALLLLSPLFLIVAVLIRLESKGPVFYYSLRVGTGYRIFRFYKFRSMSTGADKKLAQMKHLNQYGGGKAAPAPRVKQQCDACLTAGVSCQSALYADSEMWCEKLYKEHLQLMGQQAFLKIKDDPRITRIGKFIRNTSIDELPQLWNVVKGDMSLVGNRPLPLYEAEKLTTDKYALRFMAPAGLTGLWQVSKRGGGQMSEEERISLDNDYAKSFGMWFDLKLLLRTIPALLQKENV